MDIDQKIMSLMLAAEDQQEAVNRKMDALQPLLQALEKTCGNLANERRELAATISGLRESSSSLDNEARKVANAFSESIPQFKTNITRGVNEAISAHLNSIAENTDKAVSAKLQPLLENIQTTNRQVEVATHNLSMKYFLLIVCSAGLIVIAAFFAVNWQQKMGLLQEINALRDERAYLQSNIANQILIGGKINIIDCADTAKRARKCIEVPSKPEFVTSGNRTYVVPRGY